MSSIFSVVHSHLHFLCVVCISVYFCMRLYMYVYVYVYMYVYVNGRGYPLGRLLSVHQYEFNFMKLLI